MLEGKGKKSAAAMTAATDGPDSPESLQDTYREAENFGCGRASRIKRMPN